MFVFLQMSNYFWNWYQGLKCYHVASTLTLTMWLTCSNCTLPWITKFLGASSKTDTTQLQQHSLLDPSHSAEFFDKMHKSLRSLAVCLAALAFLCCQYILTNMTLSLNTVYVQFHSLSQFFFVIALNSNIFGHIKIYFKPI